tara:strand:- start:1943 stop:2263 length:321 start_codon:yes stop_codon:yes gene_type:complete
MKRLMLGDLGKIIYLALPDRGIRALVVKDLDESPCLAYRRRVNGDDIIIVERSEGIAFAGKMRTLKNRNKRSSYFTTKDSSFSFYYPGDEEYSPFDFQLRRSGFSE